MRKVFARIIHGVITLVIMFFVFELMSSLGFFYYYKYRYSFNEKYISEKEISQLSSVNLLNAIKLKLFPHLSKSSPKRIEMKCNPRPFSLADSLLGYSAYPGEYTFTYRKRNFGTKGSLNLFKIKTTINKDSTRWTGDINNRRLPKIYIFGDSFVFGSGVNDEQTFSFLLQNYMQNYQVKLYALGGYSLSQAYLNFNNIKDSITSSDIIILGYADFYDVRHVVAPSRLREIRDVLKMRNIKNKLVDITQPKVTINKNNSIEVNYIDQDCTKNNGYCEKEDPSVQEMTNTTATLINYFADNTNAKIYLLHFDGDSQNPVLPLINNKIRQISALPQDFDYFIRDRVEDFDPHPGPYWHYAISRKLIEVLTESETSL